jgi:hypothetical protein
MPTKQIPKLTIPQAPRFYEPGHQLSASDYLAVAASSERWIATGAHTSGDGIAWYECPEKPGITIDALSSENGLYAGSSGIIFLYLALYEATGVEHYLDTARAGVDGLISTYASSIAKMRLELPEPLPRSEWNYCTGAAGEGTVALALFDVSAEARYLDFARRIGDDICAAARSTAQGVAWTGEPGLMLDGGIVLYLLRLAAALPPGDERAQVYLQCAHQAATQIAAAGSPDARGGWHWLGMDPAHGNMPANTYWPGFEYGTAGIGYILARAWEATGDGQLLESAREAAAHIQAIATTDATSALVFYNEPANTDLYYVGNCNGAAGHAKFFYQMYVTTGDAAYLQWAQKFAAGTHKLGAPHHHSPGYWQTQCHCCGDAALLEMDLGLWAATGEERYLDDARDAAAVLIGNAYNADERGYRWYQAFTRLDPATVEAYSGFYPGAAGNAQALLQLYTAEQGAFFALRLLDDPWPSVKP